MTKIYLEAKTLVKNFEDSLFEQVKNLDENKHRACFMNGVSVQHDEINNLFNVKMSIDLERAGTIQKIYQIKL